MEISENVRRLAMEYSNLTQEERHDFVSLVDDHEIGSEWLEEIDRRSREVDQGLVKLVDGDDFLRRLRAV